MLPICLDIEDLTAEPAFPQGYLFTSRGSNLPSSILIAIRGIRKSNASSLTRHTRRIAVPISSTNREVPGLLLHLRPSYAIFAPFAIL